MSRNALVVGFLGALMCASACSPSPPAAEPPLVYDLHFNLTVLGSGGEFQTTWMTPPSSAPEPVVDGRAYPSGTIVTVSGTAMWGWGYTWPYGQTPYATGWQFCTRLFDVVSWAPLAGSESCFPISGPASTAFPWTSAAELPSDRAVQVVPQFEVIPTVDPCIGPTGGLNCSVVYFTPGPTLALTTP